MVESALLDERRTVMSVYNIVFSPTGGTQRVADIFAKSFCMGDACIHIDLTSHETDFSQFTFEEKDICIVSVPSYGGRVPAAAVARLCGMKGNKAAAILIAVYGNRAYDDTLAELQDTLTGAGFSCIAAVASVAEHSIMPQFASGRPDAQDEKELGEFARVIRAKMDAGSLSACLNLPGNRPYREYGGVPMKPKTGKDCTGCGLCAKACPVKAIDVSNPSKTDTESCISCMRCLAVCPQKARSVSSVLLAAGSMKMKKACSDYKKNELFYG